MTINKFIELATKKIKENPKIGDFDLLVMHEGYVYDTRDSLVLVDVEDGLVTDKEPTVVCIHTVF